MERDPTSPEIITPAATRALVNKLTGYIEALDSSLIKQNELTISRELWALVSFFKYHEEQGDLELPVEEHIKKMIGAEYNLVPVSAKTVYDSQIFAEARRIALAEIDEFSSFDKLKLLPRDWGKATSDLIKLTRSTTQLE
ncbi:MAG TPA: hypothetical protein VLE51_02085 [Candidatus Saccharimonadales bacterium]|nr:hypothetical protein [Candidatus Saccharimonadales bacterium]